MIEWFYVESKHSGLHSRVPLQITQCKSPWSCGGKNIDCYSASFSFSPSSLPPIFPSCKIIHFYRPAPFPLSFPLELVIKCLTSLHPKREVFEMQTNKHLGLWRLCTLLYELLWRYLATFASSSCKCLQAM